MYAVIETGGKQYRVTPGTTLKVDTLDGEVGSTVSFDKVLALFGDEVELGSDVGDAKVTGTILRQDRAPKILVFKFKRKKQYKRTIGHRQNFTEVRVESVG